MIVQVDGISLDLFDSYLSGYDLDEESWRHFGPIRESRNEEGLYEGGIVTSIDASFLPADSYAESVSIITGLSPSATGVYSEGDDPSTDFDDLHELFRRRGFKTLDLGMMPNGAATVTGPAPAVDDPSWKEAVRSHSHDSALITVRIDSILDIVSKAGTASEIDGMSEASALMDQLLSLTPDDVEVMVISGFSAPRPTGKVEELDMSENLEGVSHRAIGGAIVLDSRSMTELYSLMQESRSRALDSYVRTAEGFSAIDPQVGLVPITATEQRKLQSFLGATNRGDVVWHPPLDCGQQQGVERNCFLLTTGAATPFGGPHGHRGGIALKFGSRTPGSTARPPRTSTFVEVVDMVRSLAEADALEPTSPGSQTRAPSGADGPTGLESIPTCRNLAYGRDHYECLAGLLQAEDDSAFERGLRAFIDATHDVRDDDENNLRFLQEVVDVVIPSSRPTKEARGRPDEPSSCRPAPRGTVFGERLEDPAIPLAGRGFGYCGSRSVREARIGRYRDLVLPILLTATTSSVVVVEESPRTQIIIDTKPLVSWGGPSYVIADLEDISNVRGYARFAEGLQAFSKGFHSEAVELLRAPLDAPNVELWRSLFFWLAMDRYEQPTSERPLEVHLQNLKNARHSAAADRVRHASALAAYATFQFSKANEKSERWSDVFAIESFEVLEILRDLSMTVGSRGGCTNSEALGQEQKIARLAELGFPSLAATYALRAVESQQGAGLRAHVAEIIPWIRDPRAAWQRDDLVRQFLLLQTLFGRDVDENAIVELGNWYALTVISRVHNEQRRGEVRWRRHFLDLMALGDLAPEVMDDALVAISHVEGSKGQKMAARALFWKAFWTTGGMFGLVREPERVLKGMRNYTRVLEISLGHLRDANVDELEYEDQLSLSLLAATRMLEALLFENDLVGALRQGRAADGALPSTKALLARHHDRSKFGWWGIYLKAVVKFARAGLLARIGDDEEADDLAGETAEVLVDIVNLHLEQRRSDAREARRLENRLKESIRGSMRIWTAFVGENEDSVRARAVELLDVLTSEEIHVDATSSDVVKFIALADSLGKFSLWLTEPDFIKGRSRRILKQARGQAMRLHENWSSDSWLVRYGVAGMVVALNHASELKRFIEEGELDQSDLNWVDMAALLDVIYSDIHAEYPADDIGSRQQDDDFFDLAAAIALSALDPESGFTRKGRLLNEKTLYEIVHMLDGLSSSAGFLNGLTLGIMAGFAVYMTEDGSGDGFRNSSAYMRALRRRTDGLDGVILRSMQVHRDDPGRSLRVVDAMRSSCPTLDWELSALSAELASSLGEYEEAYIYARNHYVGCREEDRGLRRLSYVARGWKGGNLVGAEFELMLPEFVARTGDGLPFFTAVTVRSVLEDNESDICSVPGFGELMTGGCGAGSQVYYGWETAESPRRTRIRSSVLLMMHALMAGRPDEFDRVLGEWVDEISSERSWNAMSSDGRIAEDALAYAWVAMMADYYGQSEGARLLLERARRIGGWAWQSEELCQAKKYRGLTPLAAGTDGLLDKAWCARPWMLAPEWLDAESVWPLAYVYLAREMGEITTPEAEKRLRRLKVPIPPWMDSLDPQIKARVGGAFVVRLPEPSEASFHCQQIFASRGRAPHSPVLECGSRVARLLDLGSMADESDPEVRFAIALEAVGLLTDLDPRQSVGLRVLKLPAVTRIAVAAAIDVEDSAQSVRMIADSLGGSDDALRLRVLALALEALDGAPLSEDPVALLGELRVTRQSHFKWEKEVLGLLANEQRRGDTDALRAYVGLAKIRAW